MVLMQNLEKAMALVARAEAIIITAGVGMGVDSGLPDFLHNSSFLLPRLPP
jgi:NAD-dependent SIR2 family protein deacetylase